MSLIFTVCSAISCFWPLISAAGRAMSSTGSYSILSKAHLVINLRPWALAATASLSAPRHRKLLVAWANRTSLSALFSHSNLVTRTRGQGVYIFFLYIPVSSHLARGLIFLRFLASAELFSDRMCTLGELPCCFFCQGAGGRVSKWRHDSDDWLRQGIWRFCNRICICNQPQSVSLAPTAKECLNLIQIYIHHATKVGILSVANKYLNFLLSII